MAGTKATTHSLDEIGTGLSRYSLNLSTRYASEWGSWEVARELICNAIDASPEGMKVDVQGSDTLIVTTPTVPNVAELFVIGEGSKAPGGKTIGQFGAYKVALARDGRGVAQDSG